jgi:choline dehydrogenase-like flavoprotein
MMPYYAKSYSLKGPEGELAKHLGTEWAAKNNETSGPIQVSYPWQLEDDPMPNAWLDTFKALGYEMKEDPFSGAPVGAFASLHSVDPVKKERSDAATTYYGRTVDRKNLTLLTGCLVEKILFDQASNELIATGIQYQQDGATKIAKARKEVILAAGSLQSPKMLELSGIGNSKLLNSHGIEVFIDNPNVGENLQDHLLCYISFEAKDSIKTLDDLIRRDPKVLDDATKEYNTSRTGILSHSTVIGYAYLPVTEFLSAEGKMKLKRLLDTYIHDEDRPAAKGNFGVARKILESENEASAAFIHTASQADVYDMPFGPAPGKFVTIGVMLSQPLSTGYVHITSPDPTVRPIIDPRYLSHPIDLEIFARHVQYINTIASSEPFCSAVLKEGGRRKGGENAYSTDLESVKEWVRRTGHSMWHPSSTCAMLPRDKGGVVDERLRVYGARGLRVVDASVMPIVTRANIQSSVYAVAERAADIIKIDHGLDIK